jgi:hypothetical protein
VKDAFHEYLVHGVKGAVNPEKIGTKAAAHYQVTVPAGGEVVVRLRLTRAAELKGLGADFDGVFAEMIGEADEFYEGIFPPKTTDDDKRIMRQALAGMLWSKQFYYFDVDLWLREHGYNPTGGRQKDVRNSPWYHMINADVISMPDKWEYPWYAAWDLAFHAATLAMVDVDFAKNQLELMVSEAYVHPNGQLPAYEWNFGDVNPPVHAWSVLYVYRRPGIFEELFREAAAELYLVGQPQRPRWKERLRRRLPWAGQHRRLRPERAPPKRGLPGAGGWYGVDGDVLPEHAEHRDGVGGVRRWLR